MASLVDSSVFDVNDTVGIVEDAVVVSHQNHGALALPRKPPHQLHDHPPALRIERPCGFIRQDDIRLPGQGACDGNPLFLSAAQVGRQAAVFIAKSDLVQQCGGDVAGIAAVHPFEVQGQFHVFPRRQGREQIEALEHEPDLGEPNPRQLFLVQVGYFLSQNPEASGTGPQDTAHDRQQRCFSAAGRTHQEHQLARLHVHVYGIQGSQLGCAGRINFG